MITTRSLKIAAGMALLGCLALALSGPALAGSMGKRVTEKVVAEIEGMVIVPAGAYLAGEDNSEEELEDKMF